MKPYHLIKRNDTNVLFHIPSSQFFEITEELYNKMNAEELTEDDKGVTEVLEYLEGQTPLDKYKQVKGKRLTRLAILSTQACNLRCKYCFADQGTYKEEEEMFMSLDTYKSMIHNLLDMYPEGIKLIQFFGGEPLLGFKEIKGFIPYCRAVFREKGIQMPAFGVVTNGTVFTEEMIDFFNEENIPITVSVDGPKEINDIARIPAGDWSVFDKIVEDLKWIQEKRTFPLLVELTLNKQHVERYEKGNATEWMKEIHRLGFDGGVVGVVESTCKELELSSAYKEKYIEMYKEVTDYWFEELLQEQTFCNFDILRMVKTLTKKQMGSAPCGAGVNSLTVTAKGEILPCYILYGHDEFSMGTVQEPSEDKFSEVSNYFMDTDSKRPEECKTCWAQNICAIWCRAFSYSKSKSISNISEPRCWTAMALAEAVMENLARVQNNPVVFKQFKKNVMELNNSYKEKA